MNLLIFLQIFGSACLAILIAETSGMVQWIKFHYQIQSLKPLDCALCLAWWIALLLFLARGQFINAPLFAAISSLATILVSKLIRQ